MYTYISETKKKKEKKEKEIKLGCQLFPWVCEMLQHNFITNSWSPFHFVFA